MERIKALINKLHQQSEENAEVSQLIGTLEMIQAELTQLSAPPTRSISTSKVSVMFPSANRASFLAREVHSEPAPPPAYEESLPPGRQPEYKELLPVAKQPDYKASSPPARQPEYNGTLTAGRQPEYNQQPTVTPEPIKKQPEKEIHQVESKKEDQSGWLFNRHEEVPTLVHQKEFRERNDVFGGNGASLNDRLKTEKKELASVLTEGPVRDLKKAIGINDRFVFLNELFRGDEAMYERSLKTINNFRIYPEAEYWIERELKVKLGWDEDKDVVKHFRQLVKRRFL
jgi:hypothetical protein